MTSLRWLASLLLVLFSLFTFAQQPNAVTFTVNGISGGLDSEATSAAVAADFNRDGFVDFAATDMNGGSLIIGSGLNQNGGSTFSDFQNVEIGTDELITADFNHDGILDLAAASSQSQFVDIFRGNGDGHFTAAGSLTISGVAMGLASADFNRDGAADIAVLDCVPATSCSVWIYLGSAQGFLLSQRVFLSSSGSTHKGLLIAADLNNNGQPDIAVVDGGTVKIFTGDGLGHVQSRSSFALPVGSTPTSIAWGSFNHDLLPDLVVRVVEACGQQCGFGNANYVYLNTGNASFVLRDRVPVSFSSQGGFVATGDIRLEPDMTGGVGMMPSGEYAVEDATAAVPLAGLKLSVETSDEETAYTNR